MKKYTIYILLVGLYSLIFVLSCTKEYTNPTPITTSTTGNTTTSTSGTTSSTTSGTTTSGTTSGTTTSGTTSGTTTGSAPCTPPTNTAIGTNGVGTVTFSIISGTGLGGGYEIKASNPSGNPKMHFLFYGGNSPASGVYSVVQVAPFSSSEVAMDLWLADTLIYGPNAPGDLYVSVSGTTITLTACSIEMTHAGDTISVDAKVMKP